MKCLHLTNKNKIKRALGDIFENIDNLVVFKRVPTYLEIPRSLVISENFFQALFENMYPELSNNKACYLDTTSSVSHFHAPNSAIFIVEFSDFNEAFFQMLKYDATSISSLFD